MFHFVYILESRDGRYYTGYTTDLARRLKAHRSGKGAKFTRAFGAVQILYQEQFGTKSAALKREAAIKNLVRAEKRKLVSGFEKSLCRYSPLPKHFFQCDTLVLAKKLLGVCLVRRHNGSSVVGRIVETEAYLHDDRASHSFRGPTGRNRAMFGPPGRTYIYFTYGMHHCFNVVSGEKGKGEAVLIRALEPLEGLEIMCDRRGQDSRKKNFSDTELCNGPAKLVIAMGISPRHNGASLLRGTLKLTQSALPLTESIAQTTRVGISKGKNLPYRFFLKGNVFVSRPRV